MFLKGMDGSGGYGREGCNIGLVIIAIDLRSRMRQREEMPYHCRVLYYFTIGLKSSPIDCCTHPSYLALGRNKEAMRNLVD